jgi:glycosyltransferase involved in cell wall biosynthesis
VTKSAPRTAGIVAISANSGWNILNFRRPIIAALQEAGWTVAVLAPADDAEDAIRALGAQLVPLRIDSSGTSILQDAHLLMAYRKALKAIRPVAFLGFTVKPNIYGSLAAVGLGIRVINNISGLGTAFLRGGPLGWLVRRLYRLALRKSARVFFQNPDDLKLFVDGGLVHENQAELIPGSGIDLRHFRPRARIIDSGGRFQFLFVGRLLRDKGLVEYAEAARLLKARWPQVKFAILGFAGSDNRSAVPIAEVKRWEAEGAIDYLGETEDVRPSIAEADCVVLPSYREGLPRTLLEASAMARPMVATDVPGCREIVRDGDTGFLCAARSAESLADAMESMLRLSPNERAAMGVRARRTVELQFDQERVAAAYLEVLR